MTDQTATAQQAIDIRNNRKAALFTFAAALGFDPKNVRTISVVPNEITVTQFVRVNDGEKLLDDDGNAIVSVHALRIHASEIAAQEEFNNFLEGKPSTGAFGQQVADDILSKQS